ncbi:sialic acid-binding Ig-like lectin 10 isoform X2 [Scyliorhinus torazame]|uniref:sialic acid-binding Ig-like lectin 10 isoform X2 n=1 Tax=Scyliorhinus torazame TaxID=75743 RepID=UPI003B5BC771
MIGKSYFLVSLLQVGLSQEWKGHTPREVTAQDGLCVQIPCHYSYPSHLANQRRDGVWFNTEEEIPWAPLAFHSKDRKHELPRFRHRTRLSGDLKDGDCSLIINDITREDAGPYFFRIEFDSGPSHNYYPATRLHVSDFTDKPRITPAEIIEGKRVDISCTFDTTCNGTAPVLTWDTPTDVPGSVSNTVTQHGVTLTYTTVLSLTLSPKHHRQNLTCRVRYPSVTSERTLVLTVQYAPQNLSMTSHDMIIASLINIIEGNSTVIICSVESFPASNLTWRHLSVPMNRTSSNNELWLVIPHVTPRDTGDYECVAENEHGSVEGSITITVEHAPRNLSITSLDMINASWINIIEGNSTVIICSVESFPASNLTWRHLSVPMNRTSSNNELWLVIPHVTPRDTGDYECVAENEHGSVEGSITITVEHAPRNLSITSLDMINASWINIIEGNSTVIICSVESFPASNLTWRHLSVPMNRTSSNNELWLVIPHVTPRDTGDYECVAENEHGSVEGSITITVEHGPRNLSMTSLDIINTSWINIIEGNPTVIICSVESFPASNLTWRHLNVTMNRTSSNNELWLTIPHVTSRGTGDYECAAENEHGAVEGSITIIVEYLPQEAVVSISRSSGGITEGSNITLTCSSESVPPISHYTWFRIEGNTSTQLNTRSRTLSFNPVTRENDASFYCTVRNPLGNSTSNITHLDVQYKPEISRESECSRKSEGVTCICVANSNPPGDLTWHLPRANISDNQTHGRLVSWWVRDGHLVIGSLILTGPQDEEEVTASCSVRNPHGEAMFKVYLWVKDRDFSEWTVGLLMAGIILCAFVDGILIFMYVKKRKAATEERDSEASDIALSPSPLTVKNQGKQNRLLTDPRNTTRDTNGEGDTPAPPGHSEDAVGGSAGHGNTDKHDNLLYANIIFMKPPSGDGTVSREEDTEYAQIRFQQN